jgi:hypothetical protein
VGETGEITHAGDSTGTVGRPRFFMPDKDAEVQTEVTLKILNYESRETDFGERAVVIGVEPGSGVVWSRMLAGAVLIGEFARKKPRVGELVTLRYNGTGKVQQGKFAGRDFADWTVEVHRGPQQPNWQALAEGRVELVSTDAAQGPKAIEADVDIDVTGLPEATAAEDELDTTFGAEVPFD